MKKIVLSLILIFLQSATVYSFTANSQAVKAYRSGDYAAALEQFESLLTDSPDDYELNYNAGKAAYKQQEYQAAATYLAQAAKQSDLPNAFAVQAWFDLGNTQVKLNALQEALESYEKVLTFDPEHIQAKEMIEKIKKMLEDQKKQEENKENDKQDQNQDQKQDQNSSQEDQDSQSQKGADQKDSQDKKSEKSSNNKDGSQEQAHDGDAGQDSGEKQDLNNKDTKKDGQEVGDKGKADDAKKDLEEQRGDSLENSESNIQDHERKESGFDHSASPSKDDSHSTKQDTPVASKAQGAQVDPFAFDDGIDKNSREGQILQIIEERDAQAAQQLLRMNVQNQRRPGEKNW